MHDDVTCIGCGACQDACPYSNVELDESSLNGEAYSVMSINLHDAPSRPSGRTRPR